jgi:hypothetical protein
MSLGLPYVHVSNALHFDYSGYTLLCVYDWAYETTTAALARNRRLERKVEAVVERVSSAVEIKARRFKRKTMAAVERRLEMIGELRLKKRLSEALAAERKRNWRMSM